MPEPHHCIDCGAVLANPHALRCRSCGAKERHRQEPPSTRFDRSPAAARAARAGQLAQAAEERRLAELARAAGLG